MDKTKAKIILALVFAARGTSFLFSKHLLQELHPVSILAVRFTLSFLILAVIFHSRLLHCTKAELAGGLKLGILYTISMIMEMYGLQSVDTGVAALVENMAIVLVPFYTAIPARTLPKAKTMFCAGLAVAGVGFLSVSQRTVSGSRIGMILIISVTIVYAYCIVMTEIVSRDGDPITIGMIQLGTMGLSCLAVTLAGSCFEMPRTGLQWGMMMVLVLVCSCFGFAFQPLGQKYVPAETAAVFTVINPLTASIMGITIAGETFTPAKAAGYILILTALILYNVKMKGVRD